MSTKNFILSSLLCILCAGAVNASDCTDDDCVIEPVILDEFVPAEQDIVIQEEELSEVRWFSMAELKSMVDSKELNEDQIACFVKVCKYLEKNTNNS